MVMMMDEARPGGRSEAGGLQDPELTTTSQSAGHIPLLCDCMTLHDGRYPLPSLTDHANVIFTGSSNNNVTSVH